MSSVELFFYDLLHSISSTTSRGAKKLRKMASSLVLAHYFFFSFWFTIVWMADDSKTKKGASKRSWVIVVVVLLLCAAGVVYAVNRYPRVLLVKNDPPASSSGTVASSAPSVASVAPSAPIDTVAYDAKMLELANLPAPTVKIIKLSSSTETTTLIASPNAKLWPVATAPYPDAGAMLPFKRIVAYYGNFYSKQMGVLGEFPPDQVLQMLSSTVAEWNAADPSTPVVPAIDYIAVTAQAAAGPDGDYRLRMPAGQIKQAIAMANGVNGVVFLDVQVGLSTVEKEVPLLEQFLKLPNVELALDPEFDMHNGERPGTVIGTMDASDINFAANYLANLVQQNNLPPKILVVHRFTEDMVTNYKEIKPLPEVQVVMDMDGFGFPAKKINTYERVIVPEPVQFTGFKLFFKNDAAGPMGHLMAPSEVLKLSPEPSYIQYQ